MYACIFSIDLMTSTATLHPKPGKVYTSQLLAASYHHRLAPHETRTKDIHHRRWMHGFHQTQRSKVHRGCTRTHMTLEGAVLTPTYIDGP